jgi:hypothetical protein
MTNAGASFGDTVDIGLREPNPMPERHPRAKQAKSINMFKRRTTAAAFGIGLLIAVSTR